MFISLYLYFTESKKLPQSQKRMLSSILPGFYQNKEHIFYNFMIYKKACNLQKNVSLLGNTAHLYDSISLLFSN